MSGMLSISGAALSPACRTSSMMARSPKLAPEHQEQLGIVMRSGEHLLTGCSRDRTREHINGSLFFLVHDSSLCDTSQVLIVSLRVSA